MKIDIQILIFNQQFYCLLVKSKVRTKPDTLLDIFSQLLEKTYQNDFLSKTEDFITSS